MSRIIPFSSVDQKDIGLVGGKNASLGTMIQHLTPLGIKIPDGFIITAKAYSEHIEKQQLKDPIIALLKNINKNELATLQQAGKKIRVLIEEKPLLPELVEEITQAYEQLKKSCSSPVFSLAVRSSATAEDLPSASFAGQQESYLNVRSLQELLKIVPRAFASLFTDRAISYRIDHDFDHMAVALSLGVQLMVRSDLACSGVIFTLDTESGHPDVIAITSAYGLGEPIVQGSINPDECYVHKQLLRDGYLPLVKKRTGSKKEKLIFREEAVLESTKKQSISVQNKNTSSFTQLVPVDEKDQRQFSLSEQEIFTLARYALLIEDYYSEKAGSWVPMDIEWAKDGIAGELFIVQARPETVHSKNQHQDKYLLTSLSKEQRQAAKLMIQGQSIGSGVVSGPARIINNISHMQTIQKGDILITEMTDPDWEPIMKIAAGIVTNRGGRTCHAAIVSRELGIPAIVGTESATTALKDGELITLDCSAGSIGSVYQGVIQATQKAITLSQAHLPNNAQCMLNLGVPEEAFQLSRLPAAGVGLARLEFIINTSIQAHPMAFIFPDRITDHQVAQTIKQLADQYPTPQEFFVTTLAQEIGTIAAAFYPRPVIVRLSDFKSNEYKALLGGSYFEPEEENPMLGLRGASRYTHESYAPAFDLECQAIKKAREIMGFSNIIVMLPFVRTVQEAQACVKLMSEHGLERGRNGLELYMMCELPSNVILMEQFAQHFDGFSIGSNDLTQMILGVDRDSHYLSQVFNEQDPAVMFMIHEAITKAHAAGKKIGICGQAPSDHPELFKKLIDWGIDTVSFTPDAFIQLFA